MSPIARSRQINQILERHGQGLGPGAGFQTRPLTGRCDRGNDFRAGWLNVFKRFGEAILVSRIEKNVFAGGPNGFEINRLANRKRYRLGFGFSYALGCFRAPRVKMQQQMANLVRQDGKFHCRVQVRQQLDAVRRALAVGRPKAF
jgi:hypothetical protein